MSPCLMEIRDADNVVATREVPSIHTRECTISGRKESGVLRRETQAPFGERNGLVPEGAGLPVATHAGTNHLIRPVRATILRQE